MSDAVLTAIDVWITLWIAAASVATASMLWRYLRVIGLPSTPLNLARMARARWRGVESRWLISLQLGMFLLASFSLVSGLFDDSWWWPLVRAVVIPLAVLPYIWQHWLFRRAEVRSEMADEQERRQK